MHVAYPLAYRNPVGLFTIGFVLCPVIEGVQRNEYAEFIEMVSETMIRACCGNEFADAVSRVAQSLLSAIRERGEPSSDGLPKPFTRISPVTSFMRNRDDAICSLAMMISECGHTPQPSSAMLGVGMVCGDAAPM